MNDFLAFVECAGCGELFPVRNKHAMKRAKWCSDRCRKQTLYSTPCVDCGTPTNGSGGHGPNGHSRCVPCSTKHTTQITRDRWIPYRKRIEQLWAEGKTAREICEIIGRDYNTTCVASWRSRGYRLPYRRTPEQRARILAGSDRMEKARASRKVAA